MDLLSFRSSRAVRLNGTISHVTNGRIAKVENEISVAIGDDHSAGVETQIRVGDVTHFAITSITCRRRIQAGVPAGKLSSTTVRSRWTSGQESSRWITESDPGGNDVERLVITRTRQCVGETSRIVRVPRVIQALGGQRTRRHRRRDRRRRTDRRRC